MCTHNPLLIKGLYGILRDEGYDVEITDHPAHAVRLIMENRFLGVILDSKAFGLPAEDAVQIIKTIAPEIRIILLGYPELETDTMSVKVPSDLDVLRKLVHGLKNNPAISYNKKEEKVWH